MSLFLIVSGRSFAQNDFCEAVTAILRDAPNDFRNVRTLVVESGVSLTTYATGIHIPGAIKERFVASHGMFYEGAFALSANKDSLKPAYQALKSELLACLDTGTYTLKERPVFDTSLKMFPKVSFLPHYSEHTDFRKLNGHVAMEVEYNRFMKNYTLEFFIFRH